ncbi:Rho termination factor N-terminal domain-containing protein [Acetobacterium wieringae]|uniref:Rho termination factor N-terminal domain-containing protein n=1 Tax=Acetobacterium wieringae TaxID=52694 RepID=A0ABY6HBT6_9FIRM|nr:Rho termination factor N-terminal domain-containing protein [Acetobacterium wieringae]UYO61817.1 Rho termination factor N-terminal domain-containing protein [Acetobacterium wieringae]
MKIKMIKRAPGSIDGIRTEFYEEGQIYDLPLFMANSFEAKGYAVKIDGAPQEQKVISPVETKHEELSMQTMDELKEIAKSMGISGYSKLNKEDLIKAIHDAVN